MNWNIWGSREKQEHLSVLHLFINTAIDDTAVLGCLEVLDHNRQYLIFAYLHTILPRNVTIDNDCSRPIISTARVSFRIFSSNVKGEKRYFFPHEALQIVVRIKAHCLWCWNMWVIFKSMIFLIVIIEFSFAFCIS